MAFLESHLEKEQPAPHFCINKEPARPTALKMQRIQVHCKMNIDSTPWKTTHYLLQQVNNYSSLNNCPQRSLSQWLAISYHMHWTCAWNVIFMQNRGCRLVSWGNLPRHGKSEQICVFSSRKTLSLHHISKSKKESQTSKWDPNNSKVTTCKFCGTNTGKWAAFLEPNVPSQR